MHNKSYFILLDILKIVNENKAVKKPYVKNTATSKALSITLQVE